MNTAQINEKMMKIAVALESLQLNKARALSPCDAKSPTTDCTLLATLRNLSYLILTISGGLEVGNVSNSSSNSSGSINSACDSRASM